MQIDLTDIVTDHVFGTVDRIDMANVFVNIQGTCTITENGLMKRPDRLEAFCRGKKIGWIWHLEETARNDAPLDSTKPAFTFSAVLKLEDYSEKELAIYAVDGSGKHYPLNETARLAGRTEQETAISQTISYWRRLYDSQINRTIAERDMMAGENYFEVGVSAISRMIQIISVSNLAAVNSILDCPSGHGRVGRFLRAVFPYSELFSADIDHDGVQFCASQFNARPVFLSQDIEKAKFPSQFDLIWVGSLFTHFREETTRKYLSFFSRLLNDGGIIIATFHGIHHLELCRTIYENVSWSPTRKIGKDVFDRFRSSLGENRWDYEDFEHDKNRLANLPLGHEYGLSVSSPINVMELIKELPGSKVIAYIEKGWAEHQDIAAFQITKKAV